MSKLDRFLAHLVSRGGIALRMDPGEPPVIELPGGHRQTLMAQEMLGTVLDGVAKEIIPESLSTDFLRGERVAFEYPYENSLFHVICTRSKFGTQIVLARLSLPSSGSTSKPATVAADGTTTGTSLGKLDPYLRHLLGAGGSDLYLNAEEPVAIRKDGVVEQVDSLPPLGTKAMEELLKGWVPPMNWEAFSAGQETEFALTPPGMVYRLRVRVVHDLLGPAIALRVIPRVVPEAEALGLSAPIRRLANLNKGLVLLAGPSGSGKTTTMASLLELVNQSRPGLIVTVEDSIEFVLGKEKSLIRQKEVGRDPVRQVKAIKAALQMDPDILGLGELRSREALELALQGAQMGRLVLLQVPAASLLDTFYWLLDTYPEDQRAWIRCRLSDHLRAVLVHSLYARVGGGRIAAIETLFNNSTIASHLREGRLDLIPGAMKLGRYGQVSHTEATIRLIQEALLEPLEAYRRCHDREALITGCKKAGIPFDPRAEGHITEQ